MNKQEIIDTKRICREILVSKMLDYVRQHGRPVMSQEREVFDLSDGGRYTMLVDLRENPRKCFSIDFHRQRENYSVECLYIGKDDDGEEHLMSYCFYNWGPVYDDRWSEGDHEYMNREPLEYVVGVASALEAIEA